MGQFGANSAARATKGIITHGGIVADVVKEQQRELVMLWPINRQRDSVELLKEFLDGTESLPQRVVVGSLDKKRGMILVVWEDRCSGSRLKRALLAFDTFSGSD